MGRGMMCMKCGAIAVVGSEVCRAHGGKSTDHDNECEFGEVHVDGVPCRWCDPVEGEW